MKFDVDHAAPLPDTLRVRDPMTFGKAVILWALMDPAKRPKTLGELKKDYPWVAAALEFPTGNSDGHELIFDQGEVGKHRVALPALEKLIPMIELYLKSKIDDFAPPAGDRHPDIKPAASYPTIPAPGGAYGYEIPEFYAQALDGNHPLTTDHDEYFYSRVGDYSFNGCR